MDATLLRSLEPCTHIYSFDLAMPPFILSRFVKLFNASSTAKVYVSFVSDLARSYGLNAILVEQRSLRMMGSLETHSAYIYVKRSSFRQMPIYSTYLSKGYDSIRQVGHHFGGTICDGSQEEGYSRQEIRHAEDCSISLYSDYDVPTLHNIVHRALDPIDIKYISLETELQDWHHRDRPRRGDGGSRDPKWFSEMATRQAEEKRLFESSFFYETNEGFEEPTSDSSYSLLLRTAPSGGTFYSGIPISDYVSEVEGVSYCWTNGSWTATIPHCNVPFRQTCSTVGFYCAKRIAEIVANKLKPHKTMLDTSFLCRRDGTTNY